MSLEELLAASPRLTSTSLLLALTSPRLTRTPLVLALASLTRSSGLKRTSGARVISFLSRVIEVPSGNEKADDGVQST